jgi:drug/metabolite transporter (DMT)-like permease
MEMMWMGEALALLSAFGYTSQLILIKKGCQDKSASGSIPIQLFVVSSAVFMLMVIYSLKILIFDGFTIYNQFLLIPIEAIVFVIADGLLGPMGGLFLLTKATELIGPSRTSVFRGTNPIFAAIISSIALKENPGLLGACGIALLVTGIVVVSWNKDSLSDYKINHLKPPNGMPADHEPSDPRTAIRNESTSKRKGLLGSSLALLSGLSFALAQTARGTAIARGATAESIVFWGTMTSLIVLLVIHYLSKKSFNFAVGIQRNSSKYYIYAGAGFVIGASALALSFIYIDVWKAVAIRNMQPVLSIMLSWLFLKRQESINIQVVIGALLVTGAILIFVVV